MPHTGEEGYQAEGKVTAMTDDQGGPRPDLYQVLGVPPGASHEQIAQAWRRRARAEHPDSRPRDAAAPARFRELAQAWQVLGDPVRRAAYDRALGPQPGPGAAPRPGGPAAWTAGPPRQRSSGVQVTVAPLVAVPEPLVGVPEPPLRAGPVWVEGGSRPVPADLQAAQAEVRLAILADLAIRSLTGWDWPW